MTWSWPPHGALNRVVEWALLATSCFFWYQLFADTIAGVEHRGPIGWAVLCALGLGLGYGAASDAVRKLHLVYVATPAWVKRIRFPPSVALADTPPFKLSPPTFSAHWPYSMTSS